MIILVVLYLSLYFTQLYYTCILFYPSLDSKLQSVVKEKRSAVVDKFHDPFCSLFFISLSLYLVFSCSLTDQREWHVSSCLHLVLCVKGKLFISILSGLPFRWFDSSPGNGTSFFSFFDVWSVTSLTQSILFRLSCMVCWNSTHNVLCVLNFSSSWVDLREIISPLRP